MPLIYKIDGQPVTREVALQEWLKRFGSGRPGDPVATFEAAEKDDWEGHQSMEPIEGVGITISGQ